MSIVNNCRKILNNKLRNVAKQKMKTDTTLKRTVLDIKYHFKKDSWSLSYDTYLSMSGVDNLLFIQALLLLKMKIYFCKTKQEVLFKKESK